MKKLYSVQSLLRKYAILILFTFSAMGYTQKTFTVSSTADNRDADISDGICSDNNGDCTLRAAIENANQTPETDTIEFNIAGEGVQRIHLLEGLPDITETIILDATTQPGYMWETPKIVLTGNDSVHFGITLAGQSSGSTIKGLYWVVSITRIRKSVCYMVLQLRLLAQEIIPLKVIS